MALLLKAFVNKYSYFMTEASDQRTTNWFLIPSPIPVIFIITCYLMFVNDLGPKFMKNRKPFNVDRIMIVYNLIQVVACLYLAIRTTPLVFQSNFMCHEIDYSMEAIFIAKLAYFYFALKIIDLLDTVFFVLRKNNRQVTFLHVYHHSVMVLYTWIGVKYLAGGQGIFLGCINCYVHAIMYFYYLLTAYDSQYKKSVWWKKYITQLQLLQFFAITVWFMLPLFVPDCKYPRIVTFALLPQVSAITMLFMDFYYKTYIKKPVKVDSNNNLDEKLNAKILSKTE